MWVKDNTLPMHRTVYFGGGEFRDDGFDEEESCIYSGLALGQWNWMLTFDVATAESVSGTDCGVRMRSPDWGLGVHIIKGRLVAGTYNGVTGETSLYIDGKIVHTDYEGSDDLKWPAAGAAQFVVGRNGHLMHSMGGSGGMDGELDEMRVWTVARSLDELVGGMHKTMPDNGAFVPTPKRLLLSTYGSNVRKTRRPSFTTFAAPPSGPWRFNWERRPYNWWSLGHRWRAGGAQRQLPCGSRAAGASIVDHAGFALQAHCSAELGREQVCARGLQEDFDSSQQAQSHRQPHAGARYRQQAPISTPPLRHAPRP